MKTFTIPQVAILSTLLIVTSGCNDGPKTDDHDDHGSVASAAHEHPSEGPHHGHLIELGNEEYHAELVHDDSTVTIYLLDGAAKNPIAIEATDVTINLKHGDKPEQFKLTAAHQEGDAEGTASRFQSSDSHLASHMDDAASEAKLSVTINGTPYSGIMSHSHAGHDHAHDDHGDHGTDSGHDHADHDHGAADDTKGSGDDKH